MCSVIIFLCQVRNSESECYESEGIDAGRNNSPEGQSCNRANLDYPNDFLERISEHLDVEDIVFQAEFAVWCLDR